MERDRDITGECEEMIVKVEEHTLKLLQCTDRSVCLRRGVLIHKEHLGPHRRFPLFRFRDEHPNRQSIPGASQM